MVREYEREYSERYSSFPLSLSLSLSLLLSHLPREGRESGQKIMGWLHHLVDRSFPLPYRIEYGVHRHMLCTHIQDSPRDCLRPLHVAFFPFLSLLPFKIMQHATTVRLHTNRSTITRFARTYRSPDMDCAALRNYLSSGLVQIQA